MNTHAINAMLKPAFIEAAESIAFDYETYSDAADSVETVESVARDGFIPFTDGGYRAMLLTDLSACAGSGKFPGNAQIRSYLESVVEQSYQDAVASFIEEHPHIVEACGGDPENVDYHGLYDAGLDELAEELSMSEHEWLSEGGTFWIELRAQYYAADNYRNKSGVDEIWLCVGVNTDFTYGRDSGLDVIRELTIPARRLTPARAETILNELARLA